MKLSVLFIALHIDYLKYLCEKDIVMMKEGYVKYDKQKNQNFS